MTRVHYLFGLIVGARQASAEAKKLADKLVMTNPEYQEDAEVLSGIAYDLDRIYDSNSMRNLVSGEPWVMQAAIEYLEDIKVKVSWYLTEFGIALDPDLSAAREQLVWSTI